MLSLASRPGTLSFALGLPAPELFPKADLSRAAAAVLEDDPLSLQYTPPLERLKEHVVQLMVRRGISCSVGQVFLTAGAQQGLSLLARLLLEPGSRVAIEQLTYTGFRQVLEPFSPELVGVPTCADDGMDVDTLASDLATKRRPALIYVIPEGHNPLGVSLGVEKRARLALLAARYGVPVIEDDAYGFLQYGNDMTIPLRAHDTDWVCYVGSFSKILAPGLRQGWLVVPEEFGVKLSIAKESNDLNTATLAQRILCAYLDTGLLPMHMERLRCEYRARRNAMLQALEAHFPEGARWRSPEAGVFVWVELPSNVQIEEVLKLAVEEEQVAFLPGHAFSAHGADATHCMRLNFSYSPVPAIEEGIYRLSRAVDRALHNSRRWSGTRRDNEKS